MLDGLLYGAGDAVIGINPASDSVPDLVALLHLLDDADPALRDPHTEPACSPT